MVNKDLTVQDYLMAYTQENPHFDSTPKPILLPSDEFHDKEIIECTGKEDCLCGCQKLFRYYEKQDKLVSFSENIEKEIKKKDLSKILKCLDCSKKIGECQCKKGFQSPLIDDIDEKDICYPKGDVISTYGFVTSSEEFNCKKYPKESQRKYLPKEMFKSLHCKECKYVKNLCICKDGFKK